MQPATEALILPDEATQPSRWRIGGLSAGAERTTETSHGNDVNAVADSVFPPLVGYFPKSSVVPPPWMAELGIREVASVSQCISGGPEGWMQAWKHNPWGFFDSPDLAWSVVPKHDRADFQLYAYRAHALDLLGNERPVRASDGDVQGLPESFVPIGYDVVSRSSGGFFECSPLSCNHLAQEIATNAYCLIEARDQATDLALRADTLQCEPGPYYVLEVFRER